MDEIVRKISGPPKPIEGAPSLKETQSRELQIRVEAEALEKMRKQATVSLESPPGSTWSIVCDEGAYLKGDDSAPPPLVYFSGAVAF